MLVSAEAQASDFMSFEELGLPMRAPDTSQRRRLWRGVSVFVSEADARDLARVRTPPRTHLARLNTDRLQEGASCRITYEQTGRNAAHYTMWGDAECIMRCVDAIIPVDEPDQDLAQQPTG